MADKNYINWEQLENMVNQIAEQIRADDWRPDYIVGITRGGSVPAVMLSHVLDVPCEMLKVQLRDGGESETNCWMADDAYGYYENAKNILIVDDINDTGATFEYIMSDWQSSCLPGDVEKWNSVWGNSVRFAVLVNNRSSKVDKISYCANIIDKSVEDVWQVFPWEK